MPDPGGRTRPGTPAWCSRACHHPHVAGTRNIDLHLLTVLDHLLRERSVTSAARRLGVSQPSVSASLAKLRRHFGDDLLVRQDGAYVLTPVGARLAERIGSVLAEVRDLFEVAEAFDAAGTDREFRLVATDHFTMLYGAALVAHLRQLAPGVRFRFAPLSAGALVDLPGRLLEVDGLMLPRASVPDFPFVDLVTDEWDFVVCRRDPLATAGLRIEDLEQRPWTVFRADGGGHIPPVEYLHSQGLRTRIDVIANDLPAVPFLVAGSDRIGIVPRRLGRLLADASRTSVLESPVALPSLTMTMLWHPAHEFDAGHSWLRAALARFTLE